MRNKNFSFCFVKSYKKIKNQIQYNWNCLIEFLIFFLADQIYLSIWCLYINYKTQTLFGLGVFWCRICVSVGHRHDTDTYNYIKLYYFFKLLSILTCLYINYEAQSLFGLGVFWCRTRVSVRHQHDTDTYNYIKLYHFFKLLSILTYRYLYCIRYPYCIRTSLI
jgi:uncharacterized membrane protein YhaH (DUF805 family)